MRFKSVGHAVFAVTLIGLGILGLANHDFAAMWQPIPEGWPVRAALASISASLCLVCGVGLLWQRTAGVAARVLLAYVMVWFLSSVPDVLHAPLVEASWYGCAEYGVMLAAALVLCAWFSIDGDRPHSDSAVARKSVCIARVLYGLCLIPFGLGHFFYLKRTVSMVPGWLPWHLAWAYFTGCAFLIAAAGALLGICARLVVTLSALQIGTFVLLVWVPFVLSPGPKSGFLWTEAVASWALTAAAWLVSDSYRGMPWIAVNQR